MLNVAIRDKASSTSVRTECTAFYYPPTAFAPAEQAIKCSPRTSKSQPQRQHQQRISSASPPNIDTSIRRTSTPPSEDQPAPYSTGVDDKDTELPSDLDSVIPVRSQFLETVSRFSALTSYRIPYPDLTPSLWSLIPSKSSPSLIPLA